MKSNVQKTIVINGATGGIGSAIAKKLAQQGYSLALIGRNADKLSGLKNEIKPFLKDNQVEVFVLPELKKEHVEYTVNSIIQKFKDIYAFINSAGYVKHGKILDVSDEHWSDLFNISLMSNIWFISLLSPTMIKSKKGRIIFINGIFSKEPSPDCIINSTFTGAIRNFSKSLSKDLGQHNLTVNIINPGPTDTALWKNVVKKFALKQEVSPAELSKKFAAGIPLQRIAHPEDIANCAAYLCSPEAEYINGASFTIDGGLTSSC